MPYLRYSDGEMPRANRRLREPAPPGAFVRSAPAVSHEHRVSRLDASERALLKSVERGECATVAGFPAAGPRYARYAKATLRRRRKT